MDINDLTLLANEVRLTYHALVAFSDALLEDRAISVPQRAVLEVLARDGPRTVPDVARSRGVSRQHIQTLADGCVDLDLVEFTENPAHRRSRLARLTPAGRALIAEVGAAEQAEVARRLGGRTLDGIDDATRTLRTVRTVLGST